MDLDKAQAEYEAEGYAVIPSVFGEEEINLIRRLAYDMLEQQGAQSYIQRTAKGNPALLFWPAHMNEYMFKVAHDARMRIIVKHFLGDKVRQLNNQIYFRESGDGDEFEWHQDICFRTPTTDFVNVEQNYLQTIIAIDEITEDNGAVQFVPGSHKLGDLNLVPRNDTEQGLRSHTPNKFKGVPLLAKPGDVAIWSVMSIHGSQQNLSGRSRMTYMNGFCKDESLINKKRFPEYGV